MSLTYGFYNSQNGDRVYSTSQLSDFLDGLITDGVFAPISDGEETHHGLKVVALPTPAMAVHVSVGKAWFNGTWTYIDSAYQVNLAQANLVLNRIDAIVLTVNKTRASRSNYIEVISGTETSGIPQKPTVEGDIDIYRYVLAWVTVSANAQAITDSAIEDNIGTESGIPFVDLESPLGGNYPSTEALLLQYKTEFDEWFNHMKDQLDTDAAGHLQAEIDEINGRTIDEDSEIPFKFGIDGEGNYGYIKDGADTVTPFRHPSGNANASDVLSGKTFANANSDALEGSMSDYSGNSRQTIAPTGGTGNEQLSLSPGKHDSVIVNRTAPYDAGRAQGRADTYSANLKVETFDYSYTTPTGTYHDLGVRATLKINGETKTVSAHSDYYGWTAMRDFGSNVDFTLKYNDIV